jgi:N-methylhydantoinase B
MGSYLRPASLADAVAALAGGPRTIVAGATDVYPARVGRPVDDEVLDLSGVGDLRTITDVDGGWRIPALATWTDVIRADLPPAFDGLRAAARTIGGVQIQHRGTLVGNLCNASPAADGLPNLLALDAEVEILGPDGVRQVPVDAFVVGNRRTILGPGELVTAILVPAPADVRSRSTFRKLGSRAYLVISIASVAVRTGLDDAGGRITTARVAVGACSEVPRRVPAVEARLTGAAADPALAADVVADDLAPLDPIDDVRGSADYRRTAALVLVRRAIRDVLT